MYLWLFAMLDHSSFAFCSVWRALHIVLFALLKYCTCLVTFITSQLLLRTVFFLADLKFACSVVVGITSIKSHFLHSHSPTHPPLLPLQTD